MKRAALRRAAATTALTAGFVLAVAAPAAAHVTVNPSTATQGGFSKVSFRVPNESDTASTTKVEINLAVDHPVASVSLKPVPGWTAVAVKSKLATPIKVHDSEVTEAVTKITWTADAASVIKPGTFQEFDVSLGPLPETDQIVFKALQTYSDNTVVRWIDEPAAGTEPEHPAPVLKLTAATGDTHGSAAAPSAAAGNDDNEAVGDGDAGDNGTGWGVAGLVVGLAGLVLALLAYRKAAQRP